MICRELAIGIVIGTLLGIILLASAERLARCLKRHRRNRDIRELVRRDTKRGARPGR